MGEGKAGGACIRACLGGAVCTALMALHKRLSHALPVPAAQPGTALFPAPPVVACVPDLALAMLHHTSGQAVSTPACRAPA